MSTRGNIVIKIFILLLLSFSMLSYGQVNSTASFGLFENEELLEITLKFDITTYLRKKPKDDYLKAWLTIHKSEDDSLTRQIRLKTRGIFRHSYCTFAPIELNLKKVEFGYSDLDSISKLKLVTQCSYGKDDENWLLREYLVYRLFNVMTDTSFRVRLLKINFIDSDRERKPIIQYGFLLEPEKMLADRINALEIKTETLNQKHIYPGVMDRLAIFNFMAGNFDWSIPGRHNVKVFKPASLPQNQYAIAIPYDFDWSGIVNASYAVPAHELGISSVRERIFLGICRDRSTYFRALTTFLLKKEEMYAVVRDFPYLKDRDKQDILIFLDEFFDQLNGSRSNIIYYLMNSCKDLMTKP